MRPQGLQSRRAAETCAWALLTALSIVGCAPATGLPERSIHEASAPTAAPPHPTADHEVGLSDAGLPTLTPDDVRLRVPTRVRIPELGIDLAVVEPPEDPDHFPFCGVAEFLTTLSRPGQPGSTFIYAHARVGMFLPILLASRVHDGRSMLGMRIEVFTSDDRRFTYEVTEVRRHMTSLESAFLATAEQVVLQTSEGPRGTIPKVMLLADPIGQDAADAEAAHPEVRIVRCS
jgi:hypothetical protein